MPDADPDAPAALRRLRVVWTATLIGVTLAVLLALLLRRDAAPPPRDAFATAQVMLYAGTFAVTGVAYFARMQWYKRHWRADRVTPAGYVRGNVVLFALLAATAGVALACYLVLAPALPLMLPALVMTGLIAINFPTGLPMTPVEPRLP